MTSQQQHDHWLKFHRFQMRYENIYSPLFAKAIREQVNDFTSYGTLTAVQSGPIYKVLYNLYTTIPHIWAASATLDIRQEMRKKERMPIGFSERIVQLMKAYYGIDLLNTAEGITETTRELIQAVLTQQATEGFGFDEVVKRLEVANFPATRGRLIARTETVAAANAASNIAAKDTGLVMDKIWIAARDNRTRLHHREVNQAIVGMNDDFTVGSSLMAFPGDKRGGAAEVCNCRCTTGFIPRRDSNGRLIRG